MHQENGNVRRPHKGARLGCGLSVKPTRHILFAIPRNTNADDRRTLRDTADASHGCVEYNDNYLVVKNNRLGLFYVNKLLKILGDKYGKYGVNAFWMDSMSTSDFIEAIEREEEFESFKPIKKPRSRSKSTLSSREGFRRS